MSDGGDITISAEEHAKFCGWKAKCARLEKAATNLLSYYENSLNAGPGPRPRTETVLLRDLRIALSDTAQETGILCDSGGGSNLLAKMTEHKAADMRERAAKLIRNMEPDGFDPRRFVDQIADAVEALPIDAAQEGE